MALWGQRVALRGHRRKESGTSGTDEGKKWQFGDIGWHFGAQEGTKGHFVDTGWQFGDV